MWRYISVIQHRGQEDCHELQASLSYTVSSRLGRHSKTLSQNTKEWGRRWRRRKEIKGKVGRGGGGYICILRSGVSLSPGGKGSLGSTSWVGFLHLHHGALRGEKSFPCLCPEEGGGHCDLVPRKRREGEGVGLSLCFTTLNSRDEGFQLKKGKCPNLYFFAS